MSTARNWPESDKFKFVDLYRKCECLWNPADENYNNRNARDKAYNYVNEQMAIPQLDVKRTIKSMRDTYLIERNKIFKYMKTGNVYVPRLSWYKSMDAFLNQPKFQRDIDSHSFYEHSEEMNIGISDDSTMKTDNGTDILMKICENTSMPTISSPDNTEYQLLKEEIDYTEEEEDDEDDEEEIEEDQLKGKNEQNFVRTNKRPASLLNFDDDLNQLQSSANHDEFYYLGMHVASQLRNLPIDRALSCQMKIQKILIETRLKYEKTKNGSY